MANIKDLNIKHYFIKKNLYQSYLNEQKHHKKEILKEEERLKKQHLQNEKYKSLPEYEWLRSDKFLYDEQLQLESSISSIVSYYKHRLEKLPQEIAYEKSEMNRLKKLILAQNPSFDFNVSEKPAKRNYKKEIEFQIEKLGSYEKILQEKNQELKSLNDKLNKVQSVGRKSKDDKKHEQDYIKSISDVRFSINRMMNCITGVNIQLADIVKDEYQSKVSKK
ncbi:MAG: hypothetical protein IKS41_01280 [Alphaproteobacteria bacterium]|nr:hypothetical protein [Alphaproteobacteria bacterium]